MQTTNSKELGAVATTQRTPTNHVLNYTQTAQPSNPLVAYATSYAAVGFLPFPLAANSKIPPKGSNGFKNALSNPADVAKLFANHRGNIGLTLTDKAISALYSFSCWRRSCMDCNQGGVNMNPTMQNTQRTRLGAMKLPTKQLIYWVLP